MNYVPVIEPNGPSQLHIGILTPTNETFPILGPIPITINLNNSTYIYCGVSDGMAYYRVKPLFNHFQPIPADKYLISEQWCIHCFQHISLHKGDPYGPNPPYC